MLLTIIKKELLNNLLTARILICYAAIFMLIFVGVLIRSFHYKMEYAFYLDQARQEQEWFLEQEEMAEKDLYLWNFSMQLTPRPLSIFCEGYNKRISMPFRISTYGMKSYEAFDYDDPLMRVFTIYNVTFVIAMIVSLLCLFIGFDSFAAEREGGTLKLVLSNRLSRATYILGKFAGGYLAVLWPVVFSMLFSLVFVMTAMGVRFEAGDLARFCLLLGLVVVYLSVWFFLSMVCSIIARKSSKALLVSVLAWIFLAFAVPYGAAEAGKKAVKVLGLADFYEARKGVQQEQLQKRALRMRKLRAQNVPDFPEQQRMAYYDYFIGIYKGMNKVEKELRRDIERQMAGSIRWSRLSPAALYMSATANIAGTGMHDYWQTEDFKENLYISYKESFEAENNRRRDERKMIDAAGGDGSVWKPAPFDRGKLPSREYTAIGTGDAVRHSLSDILVLLLFNVVLFVTGFYLFIKEDTV